MDGLPVPVAITEPRGVFLTGRKVNLRPAEERDLPNMRRWVSDPGIRRGLLLYRPMSPAAASEWLAEVRRDPSQYVFAIETHAHRHIGTLTLEEINPRDGTATTGMVIGEPDCRNQGYATDAKLTLLDWAFHTLNLRKLYATVLEFNAASYRYCVKCGYREEARRRAQFYRDGRYWDELLMACFREEWELVWDRYNHET